ncbi:MAG: 30S ribosomal protein S6 [Pseudomonadota bacterium]
MTNYETAIILRQDISTGQVDKIVDQIIEYLHQEGARIARREYWGLRPLAFRIRKNRKGHYVLFNFTGNGAMVDEIQRRMKLSEDILRFMTIKTQRLHEEPSIMMRRRDDEHSLPTRRKPDDDPSAQDQSPDHRLQADDIQPGDEPIQDPDPGSDPLDAQPDDRPMDIKE